MSNAKLEVGQLVVTSSTPPGNLGLYAHDQDTIGVVGDIVCSNPRTMQMSSVVTAQSDATTGVSEIPVSFIPQRARRSNLFTKSMAGKFLATNNVLNKTSSLQFILAAPFDRVRLILPNIDTVDHPNIKACIAPSATSSATQTTDTVTPSGGVGTWIDVTVSGATTFTLPMSADAGVTPSFTVTDWMNITSLPRSDSGTLPVLLVRIESPSTNAKFTTLSAATYDGFANQSNVGERTYRQAQQSVLGVTTKGAVSSYGWSDYTQACIVQYQSSREGVTIAAFGDSLTEGGSSPIAGYNWHFQAGVAAHNQYCPVEIANFGWGGKDSNEFYELAALMLPYVKPSLAWFAAFTPNSSLSAANIDIERRYTSMFRALAADHGTTPMLWTGIPSTYGAAQGKNWGASDALRTAYNAEIATYGLPYADMSAVMTGDVSATNPPQVDIVVGASDDGLHPNATGDALMAAPALALLNKLGIEA